MVPPPPHPSVFLVDPDHFDKEHWINQKMHLNLKYQSGKIIHKATNNEILALGRHIAKLSNRISK